MKKLLTGALAALLTAGVAFAEDPIETRAHYSTNPDGAVGRSATIQVGGDLSGWTEDMIIATCGANDMANAFKGSHENCVVDMYALYAAWDDNNLYLAWQMCNTGDTWAREGDGPLTDYGHIGNVPLVVAISLDPSKTGMTGKLTSGKSIWMDDSPGGLEFTSHVDHLFYMSAQVGQGKPSMFTAVDAQGNTNYTNGCKDFSALGIKYAMKHVFKPSHLWRQNTTAQWVTPTELVSDPSVTENIYDEDCYDNLLATPYPSGLKPHSDEFDSFFEMQIPFKALGINRDWLEANGLGVRVIGTRGESALDCIPFDPCVTDNILGEYAKDNSTTHEKDDWDNFTYALANVGKMRSGNVDPLPDPTPDPTPDPEPDPASGYTVYFDNSASNWGSVFVYNWDDAHQGGSAFSGAWPGKQLSKTIEYQGRTLYVYSFEPGAAMVNPMIIFNNGSGTQTSDLPYKNLYIYTSAGPDTLGPDLSGVASIEIESDSTARYYNLQGVEVANPSNGLFIRVSGGKTSKVFVR